MCNISLSILNLKLFNTFCSSSEIVQSFGFNTNKMRLGINQIFIKMQTFEDFLDFLHKSPANEQQRNLWHFICNSQKCDIIEHEELLQIALKLFNFVSNENEE